MRVHLINPSDLSFGTAVVTPRWLFVLAAATPSAYGTPVIVDETLEPFDPQTIETGDVVGIGIHTGNALRGYAAGKLARARRRARGGPWRRRSRLGIGPFGLFDRRTAPGVRGRSGGG